MPSIYAHYLCGSEVVKSMEDKDLKIIISRYQNAFNLGTQGPDIFFYYHAWPWKSSGDLGMLAKRLHSEKLGLFFSKAWEHISIQSGSKKDLLISYLCGYICHYVLDAHTHPYVFYRSGFNLPGKAPDLKYSYYHRRFETAIDVLMLDRLVSAKPSKLKIHKLIEVDAESMDCIERLYQFILNEVYDVSLQPGQVCTYIKDMIGIQAFFRDKFGLKKKIIYSIEKLMGKLPLTSAMIHPRQIDDAVDYLNLSNSLWHLPWDRSEKRTDSFVDMFESAVAEGIDLCMDFYNRFANSHDVSFPSDSIWNRSLSSGLDCDIDVEFKYSDCVYEQE